MARLQNGMLLGMFLISMLVVNGCSSDPVPFAGKTFLPGQEGTGHWQQLQPDTVTDIFGIGLSYVQHIEETGSNWDADDPPPVFRKNLAALNRGQVVPYPSRQDFLEMADGLEAGLGRELDSRFPEIVPLVDYEVELGIVLLEPYDRRRASDMAYVVKLGFVLAGDFTSRTFMVLGEGQENMYAYWGAAKSFPGFAVVGERMWVPDNFPPDGALEVLLETTVNGELRQRGISDDNVYSARQILAYVATAFPDAQLGAGTVIMTGTPPGVAFQVPSWKRMLADLIGLDRLARMETIMESYGKDPAFLQPGDVVIHEAGPFGTMSFLVQ